MTRRELLASGLALGAGLALEQALGWPLAARGATAPERRRVPGRLSDVERVVIMIQENRSFDHYFGTLRGVRGFGDRRDRHVLAQADGTGGSVYPFRIRAASTGGGCTA